MNGTNDCSNCKHVASRLSEEPCAGCLSSPGKVWPKWEPMLERRPLTGSRVQHMPIADDRATPATTLPLDSEVRKGIPLLRGLFRYFPAALAGVASWSKTGNDKHNPGLDLHHSRGKSNDHGDCILRHLMDIQDYLAVNQRGQKIDRKAVLAEVNALSWRALALSQELHEKLAGSPLAPAAKL